MKTHRLPPRHGIALAVLVAAATPWLAYAGGTAPARMPAGARALSPENEQPKVRATTIADAWRALPEMDGQACGTDLLFDYGPAGGMRNLFCRALTVFSWKTFVKLAPGPIFVRGPHKKGRLELQAKSDFGHYSPAFVRWAVDTLVPASTDAALRAETQGIYDEELKRLARTYWRVRVAMESERGWIDAEKRAYAAAVKKGAVSEGFWSYSDLLGDGDSNWGGFDPSHVRSATMWWLRRELDQTAPLWREGLQRLLRTYDAGWLEGDASRPAPRRLPRTAPDQAPEYR